VSSTLAGPWSCARSSSTDDEEPGCTCPPPAEPPSVGTYVIVDARDPAAIGATLSVLPGFDPSDSDSWELFRRLVFDYDLDGQTVHVEFLWPGWY